MALARGDLLLAPFPFSDLRGMKRRPVCVVSSPAYNAGPDVVVAMVTSRPARLTRLGVGDVVIEDWELAGLRLASVVRAGRLLVIEQQLIDTRLGELSPSDLQQVDRGLQAVLGLSADS